MSLLTVVKRDTWDTNIWDVFGTTEFCEEKRAANLVAEPNNAYSNFAFCFGGTIPIALGVADMYIMYFIRDPTRRLRNHMVAWPTACE